VIIKLWLDENNPERVQVYIDWTIILIHSILNLKLPLKDGTSIPLSILSIKHSETIHKVFIFSSEF
jgi:hypothetical protein